MRNPVRDPMRDIDLMVLGDVGASTPLPSSTREHRIQFASRTREPASRLLPLMARTPNFEAEFVFKHFCTLCATLCAGPLISQDLDRRAGSKRAHKGGGCAQPYAPGTDFQGFRSQSGFETSLKRGDPMRNPMRGTPFSQDLDRGDGFEKDTSQKYFFLA